MQGTWVDPQSRNKDPTCRRANKRERYDYYGAKKATETWLSQINKHKK